jgi:hypothetical protein
LVPIDRATERSPSSSDLLLDYTLEEVGSLETVQRSSYLRVGELPVEDPNWEVGIESILALPYYGSQAPGEFGMGAARTGYDHVAEIYDRVPKHEVEIRRASAVISSDGHHVGHVDGFLVDAEEQITHLVLEHGHLWGKREITVPIAACAEIATDEVELSLSKDEIGSLQSVPVHRWPRL